MSMKYDPKSRRQFLIGAGGTLLMVPLMPSLLPRAEAQTAAGVKRFICLSQDNGRSASAWFPNSTEEAKLKAVTGIDYMRQMNMRDISGNISSILSNSYFNGAMRDKLLLLRGVDGMWKNTEGHQTSSTLAGNLGADPTKKAESKPGPSIDYIMAKNTKSNARASDTKSYLNLGVYPHANDMSFKYNASTKTMSTVGREYNPKNVFNSIFANISTTPSATPTPVNNRQAKAVDMVIESYRRVIASTKIAKIEKDQFQEHMDMLSELESSINATTPPTTQTVTCTKPTGVTNGQATSRDPKVRDAVLKQHMDILIAGVKCGIINIGTLMVNEPVDPVVYSNLGVTEYYHGLSHVNMTSSSVLKINTWFADKFAYFINALNVQEGNTGKTYLDNSIVYFGNCMGNGTNHSYFDMPVLIAGGGAGKLKTGRYIDYSNRAAKNYDGSFQGRNYNALLVTFMQAMGLSQADYQQSNVAEGFGSDTFHTSIAAWRTDRKNPLPTLLG